MAKNYEEICRQTLVYAICMDIIRAAISNVGTINSSDSSKIVPLAFDELTKEIKK